MFCVECGNAGKVFEALCAQCFLKRKKLIELPKSIDIVMCSTCDSILVSNKWQKQELDAVVRGLIASSVWHNPVIHLLELRSEQRFEDKSNLAVGITARVGLDDLESDVLGSTRIRLKSSTCPTCSKRHGRYYEAIIQVRSSSKVLSIETVNKIRECIQARIDGTSDAEGKSFVSREEAVRGGLDFYIGSNRFAKAIAKELAERFHGTVRSSPKLHGMVKGKEVYRVTYIVRLP